MPAPRIDQVGQVVTSVVGREVSRAARHHRALAVLCLDVDDLRAVNDTLGREAGDLVVERLPALVQAHLREGDLPVHAGGDELVVVLPETEARGAHAVAERVRAGVLAAGLSHDGRPLPVRLTAGVAAYRPGMSAEALLLEARHAARSAKQARRAASVR